MTSRRLIGILLLALAATLTARAQAFAKDAHSINLPLDAVVSNTHIDPGHYQIQWDSHGPGVTVSFSNKGKVVATTRGNLVERGKKYSTNSVVSNSDGSHSIQEIRFAGKNRVLVLGEAAPASESGSGGGVSGTPEPAPSNPTGGRGSKIKFLGKPVLEHNSGAGQAWDNPGVSPVFRFKRSVTPSLVRPAAR